jgi:hypothetical protein
LAGYLYETLETATIDQEDEDNLEVRGPTGKPGSRGRRDRDERFN